MAVKDLTRRHRTHARLRLARGRARKLVRIARNRDFRRGLRHRVAASVEHESVCFAADFRTVIDIGASRGQFALFSASRFPNARIISFEPLPEPRAKLIETLGDRVEVRSVALGSEPGTVTMNVSRQDDSSSVLGIGQAQQENFPGTEAIGTADVAMETLDAALNGVPERPCLLKIDVQGLELEVLRGAVETLAQVDEALIECSFVSLYEGQALADEVVAFALEHGLRLAGVYGMVMTADGDPIQADFHFKRLVP